MRAQPIRILLVDDDASFLHSLEALLTGKPGLEIVGKAASGKEALAAAARAEPDVAVIDVLMPTMSGIECAHLLQERAFDPAHRRHEHVDDGHVRFGAGGCRERLLSACRLADDLQPWFACKQGLERVQEGRIVVDEQNLDRLGFHRVCPYPALGYLQTGALRWKLPANCKV